MTAPRVDPCAVYLFWGPAGIEALERFAASCRAHPAGVGHELLIVLKAVEPGGQERACRSVAATLDAKCLALSASGLDLDTYRAVAERLSDRAVCFLNTSSEILADNWLARLSASLAQPGVGLVGTTASNETLLSSAPPVLRPLLRRRHPPFPNPHVRTNGFMLERDLMLSLDWRPARDKRSTLALENGWRNLTRQVLDRGLRALVVGRDGRGYEPDRWVSSRTFRTGGQENLLIADNRTREYAEAGPARRRQLETSAWGDPGRLDPI